MEMLLNYFNVNESLSTGYTPLMDACRRGSIYIELFLNAGADINAKDISQRSPLLFACEHQNSKVVRYLLENGAEIYRNDASILDMLSTAIEKQPTIVKVLIEYGYDIANSNIPYLLLALKSKRFDIFHLLLQSGANVDACDGYGDTALMRISGIHPELLEVILEKSPNINLKQSSGYSSVVFAARYESQSLLPLIEAGADLTIKVEFGYTLLHIAARYNDKSIPILLNYTYVDEVDCNGWTPIMIACLYNKYSVKAFLEKGADPNHAASGSAKISSLAFPKGTKPLDILAILQVEDIAQILKNYGATLSKAGKKKLKELKHL
eukprot:TRINITY_DN4188_c0_g1_i1.p1 TRINITY_DN4188_c0_g1~~TRINITY_DN4188_c0_g1_i1.p1  ORF type:complete len:369 (+),score=71.13 TRINITY_DN4188_c0_g1_i1:139-1107(+)